MFSNVIDEMIMSLSYEEVDPHPIMVNLSDYIFRQNICTPLDDYSRNMLNKLIMEYAIFGSNGEIAAYDLVHDIMCQELKIMEHLDSTDSNLIERLDSALYAIRNSLEKQVMFNNGDDSVVPVIIRWVSPNNTYVAEIMCFKEPDWDD